MKQVKWPSNRKENFCWFSGRNCLEPNPGPTTEPNPNCWEVGIQSQTKRTTLHSQMRAKPFTNQGISEHYYSTGKVGCESGLA